MFALFAIPDALPSTPHAQSFRSFETGNYRDLFKEIGKTDAEIDAHVSRAWKQLFYGDDASERIYYPVEPDMAYIKDTGNEDVRTEGMSYGMMVAVQLNKKEEFDRLWRWTKVNMQHRTGPLKGLFAWSCFVDGKRRSEGLAPDGEEYFAMALYFAAGRWGSGQGILNYRAEADAILYDAIHKPELENRIFNTIEKQIVFSAGGDAAKFTDPSYHLPAFYELWARWAKRDNEFWKSVATTSRSFFHRACHPVTGLTSDYSTFDGKPFKAPWAPTGNGDIFAFDAFRVAGNIAMDYAWFGADPWQVQQSNRMLEFFASQKPTYVSNYTVDGKPLVDFKSTGLIAMNATAALASNSKVAPSFVRELWEAPVPTGKYRYYDGLLYMFGLLHCSGQYRIWSPDAR